MVVKIVDLQKIYKNKVEALKGVTLSIKKGSIFALVGPNGAGKTTLIKCILGMLKPTSGSVSTLDKEPFPNTPRGISFVPEEKALYTWMKVSKMVKIFASFAENFSYERFKELVKRFDLPLERKIGELSQGNRTKLYMALAFAQNVEFYVLDEPTWGLDPIMRHEVLGVVKENAVDGKTILYSSHILSEVEEVCDDLAILKKGKLIYSGSLDSLKEKTKSDLSKAFLDIMKGDGQDVQRME